MNGCLWPRVGAAVVVLACALVARANDATDVIVSPPEGANTPPAADHEVPRRLPSIFPAQPRGQSTDGFGPRTALDPAAVAPANVPPAAAGVLGFYNNPQAAATLSQIPATPPVPRPVTRLVYAPRKPYQGLTQESTLSPYLNLFRDDDAQALPSYHMFVRPRIEQRQINAQQQREVERINRTVRTLEYEQSVRPGPAGGIPATGHGTRFLNTAGYYAQPKERR
jgi:hypothetical protein